MTHAELSYVTEQLTILKRNCVRGRNIPLVKKNSRLIDQFQHMEDEIDRTLIFIKERKTRR